MKKFCKKAAVALMVGTFAVTLTACGSGKSGESGGKENTAGVQKALEESMDNQEKSALLGDFTTITIEGETVTQDIFAEADITMLNIWGTFCGPCIQEMPELAELAEEYKGRMQVIGLIADVAEANDPAALEIIEYTGADYTHILSSADMQNGYVGKVQAVPTTVFLDKKGCLIGEEYLGARDKAGWKEIIEEKMEQIKE